MDITSCTFAYNISATLYGAAGLNVLSGTANVKDSIFYGNVIPATGSGDNDVMVLSGSAAANVSYTLMDHTPAPATCENMVIGVPQFVTPVETFMSYVYTNTTAEAAFSKVNTKPIDMRFNWDDETVAAVVNLDVHSRSRSGYYKNDGQLYRGGVTSPAIDAGDPAHDFRNEPSPNGFRVNLGFYGNTSEAALSPGGFMLFIR